MASTTTDGAQVAVQGMSTPPSLDGAEHAEPSLGRWYEYDPLTDISYTPTDIQEKKSKIYKRRRSLSTANDRMMRWEQSSMTPRLSMSKYVSSQCIYENLSETCFHSILFTHPGPFGSTLLPRRVVQVVEAHLARLQLLYLLLHLALKDGWTISRRSSALRALKNSGGEWQYWLPRNAQINGFIKAV